MLELAAKAAGYAVNAERQAERDASGHGETGLWLTNGTTCWNPLADDGEALRLAVDLGLNIEFGNDGESYSVAWDGCIGSGKFYHRESDRRNATRWAIVTVAAQADPKTPNASLSGGRRPSA